MRILPVNLQPLTLTSCQDAFNQAILMADDGYLPWIYENYSFVVLRIEYRIDFLFKLYHDLDVIHFLKVFSEVLEIIPFIEYENPVYKIKQALYEKRYVVIFSDVSMLPQQNNYNNGKSKDKFNNFHEILVNGYDEEKNEFYYVGYQVNHLNFGQAKCSFEELENSFLSALRFITENSKHFLYIFKFYLPFYTIRLKEDFKRDVDLYKVYLYNRIINYLDSENNQSKLMVWHDFFKQINVNNITGFENYLTRVPPFIHSVKKVIESKKIFLKLLDHMRKKDEIHISYELCEKTQMVVNDLIKFLNNANRLIITKDVSLQEKMNQYLEQANVNSIYVDMELGRALSEGIKNPTLQSVGYYF